MPHPERCGFDHAPTQDEVYLKGAAEKGVELYGGPTGRRPVVHTPL